MTVLDRADLDVISRQAREIRPGRAILTAIASVLFAAGWLAARFFAVAWFCAAWTAVAVREGWREGRKAGRAAPR